MKLFEGKYDQVTGYFVDAIWIIIKKSRDIYDAKGIELYASKTFKTTDFNFQIIISREPNYAAYKLDAITHNNKITITLHVDPDIEPDYYKEINIELQGTARHEIEHLLQEKNVPHKAKVPSRYMLNKINRDDYAYLMADFEVEPMVKGFYRQAKTQKEKLDIVIDDFLSYYISDDRITKKEAKEIKNKWIAFAKANLPKAQYKKITESYEFKRGLEPKEAMNTGLSKYSIKRILLKSPVDVYYSDSFVEWLTKINSELGKMLNFKDDGEDWKNIYAFDLEMYVEQNDVDEEDEQKIMNDFIPIGSKTNEGTGLQYQFGKLRTGGFKVVHYSGIQFGYIARKEWLGINESQNFTRGLDPKDAMETGDVVGRTFRIKCGDVERAIAAIAKEHNKKNETWDENPSASSTSLTRTFGFDMNPKLNFSITYSLWTTGGNTRYGLGPRISHEQYCSNFWTPTNPNGEDGTHYDYCFNNLKDAENTVIDWITDGVGQEFEIVESQNFERGLDPKDAMETGDIVERARQNIKAAIIKLADKYSSYKSDQIKETIKDSFLQYGFYKTFGLETWIFYIGYYKANDPFVSKWIVGWRKINETWVNPKYEGQPATHRDNHVNNLEECIEKIEEVLNINESINFERGLDPKDAMGIGMESKYPGWKLFHLLHQESKESENFNYVTSIDYTFNVGASDDAQIEPSFSIESKFIYSKNIDNDHITPKMYHLYLTKKEGVILNDDNTCDEKRILDLKMFNKVTWCYDIDESLKFERGLDPKDAMGTGDVVGRTFRIKCGDVEKAIALIAKENGKEDKVWILNPSASSTALIRSFGFDMTDKLEFNIQYSLWTTGGATR